jgi:hypothetical protein
MTSYTSHPHPSPDSPGLRVYGWNTGAGGTFWYRISEPLRGLALRGHQTASGARLDDGVLDEFDTILAHTLHEERASEAWEKIARRNRHRLVLDVDDDVWNFDPRTDTHRFWTDKRLLRLQTNIAMADVVTTPSEHLADILSALNHNVVVLPNYVPEWLLSHNPYNPRQTFVMGYQGARQHTIDVQTIGQDVWTILRRHRRARVHLWGELNPLGWPEGRVIRTPWQSDIPAYYRSLSMTVGLGPLADVAFNYAKSAIRAVEYAALGIPAMLTDVPVYREYVHPGYSGWLIPPGETWLDTLEWAYSNREKVSVMGQCARGYAKDWTTEKNAYKWEVAYRG